MKKSILLSLFSLVIVLRLSAQTDAGNLLIGGSLGFSSSTSENTVSGTTTDGPKYSSFSIMPFGGYFIADNLAVGLGIGFSSSSTTTQESGEDVTDKTSMFTLAPFARWYYVNGDMVNLYGGAWISFGFGTYTDEYYDTFDETIVSTDTDLSSMGVNVGPGATIMLGEKCGLDVYYGMLGFNSSKMTDSTGDYEYKESSFGLSWAEAFTFGIVFHL